MDSNIKSFVYCLLRAYCLDTLSHNTQLSALFPGKRFFRLTVFLSVSGQLDEPGTSDGKHMGQEMVTASL